MRDDPTVPRWVSAWHEELDYAEALAWNECIRLVEMNAETINGLSILEAIKRSASGRKS